MLHKDKIREEFTRQAEAFAALRELHSRERFGLAGEFFADFVFVLHGDQAAAFRIRMTRKFSHHAS